MPDHAETVLLCNRRVDSSASVSVCLGVYVHWKCSFERGQTEKRGEQSQTEQTSIMTILDNYSSIVNDKLALFYSIIDTVIPQPRYGSGVIAHQHQ